MRETTIKRKTAETDIALSLNLDGTGKSNIDTGCPFLNHMLTLFAKHSRYDLDVYCKGDVDVDYHHTTEDIGISLGKAFKEALGEKKGIERYGDIILPMDEVLIMSSVDISGRGDLFSLFEIPAHKVGDFDTELCEEFFRSFAKNAEITLHIRQICGTNSHHIIEGAFKATARALAKATAINEKYKNDVPSTKGVL